MSKRAGVPAPPIITCRQWGARQPKTRPQVTTTAPRLVVVHHTDGHAAAVRPLGDAASPASYYEQAVDYARAVQHLHMDVRGWNDSGHNFLVMRSGYIAQGRWGTVSAIEAGRMVVSAHCPGENDQPGIEHEHLPGELMTSEQIAASSWLIAWICSRTGIRPTQLYGHREFFATDCPDTITHEIPALRLKTARLLTLHGHAKPSRAATLRATVAGGRFLKA